MTIMVVNLVIVLTILGELPTPLIAWHRNQLIPCWAVPRYIMAKITDSSRQHLQSCSIISHPI